MAKRKQVPDISPDQDVRTHEIPVEGQTDDGRRVVQKIKATVISVPKRGKKAVKKSVGNEGPSGSDSRERMSGLPGSTQQVEDDPRIMELINSGNLIAAPYNLQWLSAAWEESTILRQCIDAFRINIAGFGWRLVETEHVTADVKKKFENEIAEEKARLKRWFQWVHPRYSFSQILNRAVVDQYQTGMMYLEGVPSKGGDLVGLNHCRSPHMRLAPTDPEPTVVTLKRVREDKGFEFEEVKAELYLRRYAQVLSTKIVWFKDWFDTRVINKHDGSVSNANLGVGKRATPILYRCLYSARTPYGIPPWIGTTPEIRTSRRASEINYATINRNNIPSFFIVVENGSLTRGSVQRLKNFVANQLEADSSNFSRFIILEAEPDDEASLNTPQLRIKIEPLSDQQIRDEMFKELDDNCRSKVRQSMRVAPIYTGEVKDYNKATAQVAKAITDEQVFAPERGDLAFDLNRLVMPNLGARFHELQLRTPNVTDNEVLVKIATAAEKSGGMTPRRMDILLRDVYGDQLGPLPEGIPLDVPFSVTFAQAQKTGTPGGQDIATAEDVEKFFDLLGIMQAQIDAALTATNEE